MRSQTLTSLGLLLSANMAPIVAHCEVYMSASQAPQAIFPGMKFERHDLDLSPDDVKKIESESGQNVRSKKLQVWKSSSKQIVFIDEVLGKHEFITYAVGITPEGKVAGIEIIEYKESYGQQVRTPEWRSQFVGKDANSKLKVTDDIKNISGATLSSTHVTNGVRRLLKTCEIIRDRV
jgi:Na+-translocating ferredoxin:NAD+ oxidoreductase RnfG subunit